MSRVDRLIMDAVLGSVLKLALVLVTCLLSFGESQQYMRCAYFKSPVDLEAGPYARSIEIPTSPGQYLPNQHCEWRIRSSDPGRVVKLFVHKCNIEGPDYAGLCSQDYIDIYDVVSGGAVYMTRLCSKSDEGESFESSSREMKVLFISNLKFEFTGFRLSYLTVPKKSDQSSMNDKEWLEVVVPIVVIVVFCTLVGALYMLHRWRKKRTLPQRTQQDRQNPQAVLPPRSNSPNLHIEPPCYVSESLAREENFNQPLQVYLPETSPSPQPEDGIRSSTPPPSYDYLVRHEGLLYPANTGEPFYPPDYESVVKEDQSQIGEMDSQV